ncbi:hypothetical protein [Nocardia arthritidis]|uniref:Uncharacterized protein n=1 Tax=Nocardia arthritidis TaxID=228602 RepID=A0A6G9YU56_9NOCA|nr:hypothetical protein [Nocardia arthritidis]QIS16754.1 hypothetical protein F5544_44755 [Nocardia arthritidis]
MAGSFYRRYAQIFDHELMPATGLVVMHVGTVSPALRCSASPRAGISANAR